MTPAMTPAAAAATSADIVLQLPSNTRFETATTVPTLALTQTQRGPSPVTLFTSAASTISSSGGMSVLPVDHGYSSPSRVQVYAQQFASLTPQPQAVFSSPPLHAQQPRQSPFSPPSQFPPLLSGPRAGSAFSLRQLQVSRCVFCSALVVLSVLVLMFGL